MASKQLGCRFKRANPKLFKSYSCTKGVVSVLNRAGYSIKPELVRRVAQTVAIKNPDVSADWVEAKIKELL